jgi:hypothetical protein
MIEYLRVMRPDHWLKNIFIIFGHLVAIALLAFPFGGAAPELTQVSYGRLRRRIKSGGRLQRHYKIVRVWRRI